ncbi:unnamed protein product, partial [Fusarium fujikuroi]
MVVKLEDSTASVEGDSHDGSYGAGDEFGNLTETFSWCKSLIATTGSVGQASLWSLQAQRCWKGSARHASQTQEQMNFVLESIVRNVRMAHPQCGVDDSDVGASNGARVEEAKTTAMS